MRGEPVNTKKTGVSWDHGTTPRRGYFWLLRITFTILVAGTFMTGCGKSASPPASAPKAAAVPIVKAEIAGVAIYRKALAAQDSEETIHLLEQAVRANPRLAEAWYQMGRQKISRAPDVVKMDELQGTQLFREGLEAEKEALRLLDAGKVTVWNSTEEEQARATLAIDLVGVDETLADQESSLRALRVRTY